MSSMTADMIREVEDAAKKAQTPKVAGYLQEKLGQRVVAYIAGIRDPRMVGRWTRSDHAPRGMTEQRLRTAYEITILLSKAYDSETAKAWLLGSNSRLGGDAPAYILRHAESPDDIRLVVPTARAFAGGSS